MHALSPTALADPDLAKRYTYWTGRSGRRYLFTVIKPGDLVDYSGCVVMLTRMRSGTEELLWIGRKEPGQTIAAAVLAAADTAYVHLLTRKEDDRRIAVWDLQGNDSSKAAKDAA